MSEPYWVPLSGGPIYLPNPSARVYRTTVASVPTTTPSYLDMDGERWDTDNIHDATNPSRLTCRTAGKYLIFGSAEWAGAAGGTYRSLSIRKNGPGTLLAVNNHPASGNPFGMTIMTVADLIVGDYVELYAYQDSGAALNITASPQYSAEFGMARLDAALPTTLPPVAGGELAYAEKTTNTTVTGTSAATGQTIVTAPPITLDGATPIIVEFFTPIVVTPGANVATLFNFFDGATDLGYATQAMAAGSVVNFPLMARRKLTPSAGDHTYSVRAWVPSGTGTVYGGVGGQGNWFPSYIRISRA
jgi:hypothetical protein